MKVRCLSVRRLPLRGTRLVLNNGLARTAETYTIDNYYIPNFPCVLKISIGMESALPHGTMIKCLNNMDGVYTCTCNSVVIAKFE